jgi:tetratricopeptide (TPR) repeat protein
MRKQINNAKKNYNQAIEASASIPSLKAIAQYSLGLCEEELGNFDEARKIYEEVIKKEEYEGTAAAYQAKQRLGQMNNYLQPIAFQPRPTIFEPVGTEVITPDINTSEIDVFLSELNSPNQ